MGALLEGVQQAADLGVREADACQVVAHRLLPFSPVADLLQVVALVEGKLAPGFGDVVEVIGRSLRQDD